MVSKVRILESSGGIYDGCLRQGKINGYGYRQNAKEHVCYDTHKEVAQHVENWFKEHLKSMTLSQALCYYNQGKPHGKLLNNCTYYQNYQKL